MGKGDPSAAGIARAVRVGKNFDLARVDSDGTPGWTGGKKHAARAMERDDEELTDLQERLFAAKQQSVLLIVQGMDTAGKGGIMRHVVGEVDPQGVRIKAFKAPTKEELAHPFLWRIKNALPQPGYIGVFDRSQYEDVLVVRVHDLVPRNVWSRRYEQINKFEKKVVESGTRIIKVMLHVSKDEQKARLTERLTRKDKYWKFNPRDIDERGHWDEYMDAYQAVLDRTNTSYAPWHVVPADNKWFARLAVNQLLLKELRSLKLKWPPADFDVKEERKRLEAT